MLNNAWFKLATVSLVGIVISFVVFWGIGQFSTYPTANNANGYGYQYEQNSGMNMPGANGNMQGGMNVQGMPGMNGNMQGGWNMNGNIQGGMNMNGNAPGTNMNGNMQQGMGMDKMQDMGMMNGMM